MTEKEKIENEESVEKTTQQTTTEETVTKEGETAKKDEETAKINEETVKKQEEPATESKTEGGWDAPAETKTDGGWDAPVETKTEGGWGASTTTSAWDAPTSAVDNNNDSSRNDYRSRDGGRSYGQRDNEGSGREEYHRKRFERRDNERSGSSYGQDKRFRSERDDQGDRYGGDRRGSYQPRENNYGSRDNNYGSRDSGYPPRDNNYGSRDSSYPPRESGYGSRDSGYPPRDRNSGYGSRDSGYPPRDRNSGYESRDSGYPPRDSGYGSRDSGYERSSERRKYDRDNASTYDPMSENGQKSYESRPKKVIPENVPPSKTLGLFGLSLYATEEDLREFLAEELSDIKDYKLTIITDYETKKSRGFGFVYFQCLEDSIKAKESLRGKSIKGKEIRVDYSVSDVLRPNYR